VYIHIAYIQINKDDKSNYAYYKSGYTFREEHTRINKNRAYSVHGIEKKCKICYTLLLTIILVVDIMPVNNVFVLEDFAYLKGVEV
jgi:hypothetical protein